MPHHTTCMIMSLDGSHPLLPSLCGYFPAPSPKSQPRTFCSENLTGVPERIER
ncbi:hypothetical protein QBC45DRAFT_293421, partial [Copromyces sp. CBS 386.78]